VRLMAQLLHRLTRSALPDHSLPHYVRSLDGVCSQMNRGDNLSSASAPAPSGDCDLPLDRRDLNLFTDLMARLLLIQHPDSSCETVAQIEVKVAPQSADSLVLSYIVSGQIDDIQMPSVAAAERSDELWCHTCFEIFIGTLESTEYYEFNFAPSTRWAAYRFNSYRSDKTVATEVDAPRIKVRAAPDCYTLQASVQIAQLSALSLKSAWRLGLSALIEDKAGHMSYWALAHPPGKPDFHHRDCFAYEFSPVVSL
jgi:hypothetical protein